MVTTEPKRSLAKLAINNKHSMTTWPKEHQTKSNRIKHGLRKKKKSLRKMFVDLSRKAFRTERWPKTRKVEKSSPNNFINRIR